MLTSDANRAFLPSEVGPLVVQPVIAASVALQVATLMRTTAHDFRIPQVTDDPSAAWTAEGEEITPSVATLDELEVTFKKLAGLVIISRELAEDSTPAAAKVVGDGLARDIARKFDTAFFGSEASPAPPGLEDLVGVSGVGFDLSNIDAFLEAIAAAEEVGANLTSFVANPADALTLAQVKTTSSDSNLNLLQPDATMPSRRQVAGLPLYVSTAVSAGTVWGIPKDRVMVVLRDPVRLEVDRSAYFSSDRVGLKATMRVGIGFPHPAAVVKISDTISSS